MQSQLTLEPFLLSCLMFGHAHTWILFFRQQIGIMCLSQWPGSLLRSGRCSILSWCWSRDSQVHAKPQWCLNSFIHSWRVCTASYHQYSLDLSNIVVAPTVPKWIQDIMDIDSTKFYHLISRSHLLRYWAIWLPLGAHVSRDVTFPVHRLKGLNDCVSHNDTRRYSCFAGSPPSCWFQPTCSHNLLMICARSGVVFTR